jgi:DNA polymerase I-like protein with 3'-5' exonuclease and polymerase domains
MPKLIIEGEVPTSITDPFIVYQLYNNFDAAITCQLHPIIDAQLDNSTRFIYRHEMELQKLCLEMSTKGFPINLFTLADLLHKLEQREIRAMHILHSCTQAIGFGLLNPNSPKQVADFFYRFLRLPAITTYDSKTRQQKITTDIKAMEKLRENYPISVVFVNAILAAREAHKMASVFRRGLEPNYHLRCNFTPSGTDTGRMSSQRNPFNRGTNAQNLTNEVRSVIEAPDDWYILNVDLKTAESIAVGYVSGDQAYIHACMTGDLHTAVAKQNWKHLPWTGDLHRDKKIAEQPYYRMFSYRDMAKRGGHLTNYYGTPRTAGQHLKLPTKVMQEFQDGYFAEFPGLAKWHLQTIATIQSEAVIVTQFGRKRRFWGRSGDKETHRAAIAYEPQSLVADLMNTGLMKIQRWIIAEGHTRVLSLLAQVHDAGVFLIHKSVIHALVPQIQELLKVPLDFGTKGVMVIPSDASIGKRWYKSKTDPLALQDYAPTKVYP